MMYFMPRLPAHVKIRLTTKSILPGNITVPNCTPKQNLRLNGFYIDTGFESMHL